MMTRFQFTPLLLLTRPDINGFLTFFFWTRCTSINTAVYSQCVTHGAIVPPDSQKGVSN